MALSANAAAWAVVGSYSDWNFANSEKMKEGENGVYSCTIDNLTTGFKIVDIDNDPLWYPQCSTSTPIAVNASYVLDISETESDGDLPNMEFVEWTESVSNATVTWNPSTATMKITGTASDITYPTLYLTGSFNEWLSPGVEGTVKGEESNGIYTFTVDFGTPSENVEFKLATENWGYQIGTNVDDTTVGTETATPVSLVGYGGNLFTGEKGELTLTFNIKTMMMTFGDASLTNPTPKWAVVGSYCGWSFEDAVELTGTDDNLSCTIEALKNDFKIVNIATGDWSIQYGTATPLKLGTKYTLTAKNGGPDPANMVFDDFVQTVNNVTVNWNPSTAVMEIVAEPSDLVKGYPTLFATGSFCSWDAPGEEGNSVSGSETNGIYTFEINLGEYSEGGENVVEFKLAGIDWANEIGAPNGDTVIGTTAANTVSRGGKNIVTYLTSDFNGTHTLYFNIHSMLMVFDNEDAVKIPYAEISTDPGSGTVYVYSPVSGFANLPTIEYGGSPAPDYTIVQTAPKSSTSDATATADDDSSELDVIWFSDFTSSNSASLTDINLDVTGAETMNISVFSYQEGSINVTFEWKYGDAVAKSPEPYVIDISASQDQVGKWTTYSIPAADMGLKEVTTLNTITISGTDNLIPQFAVTNIYFPSTAPLAVEEVDAEKADKVSVYNLQGICLKDDVSSEEALTGLPGGIYIINGKKVLIRK